MLPSASYTFLAFPSDTSGLIASFFMCSQKDQVVRDGIYDVREVCVFVGQILTLRPRRTGFSGPYAAPSGLHLRSNRDRRHAPGVCLLRPNRGLVPHQAGLTFGQIGTDATLQACAYSGQIGALCRIKRASPSVESGPTPRSRRALTQAESGTCAASSGLHLRSRR
jgi:hypothetical protein